MQSYNISLNTTCVWRVLRLNELQTNQKYLASSISNCKPRCLQRCNATFWPEHLTSSPWVVGNKEVVPPTWQCAATDDIIRQWIVVSASNHSVATHIIFSRFVTLHFSYSHNWNGHWKAIDMLTFRPFIWPWQIGCTSFQKVLSRTASKTSRNTGSTILMQKEAILKEILSTRV